MKNIILLLIASTLISCVSRTGEKNSEEIKDRTETLVVEELEKLAGGFNFTEGPAADPMGNVYFTDIPNNLILMWTKNDKLEPSRGMVL